MPGSVMPRMAVHGAYYAAYHAARAVLFRLEGARSPIKHTLVANRFSFHAHQSGQADFSAVARVLQRLPKARLESDYTSRISPTAEQAQTAIDDARMILRFCAAHLGFSGPKESLS